MPRAIVIIANYYLYEIMSHSRVNSRSGIIRTINESGEEFPLIKMKDLSKYILNKKKRKERNSVHLESVKVNSWR